MRIGSINNVSFSGRNVSKQVQKIVNRAMGQEVKLTASNSGFKISIPGREGAIIVEDCSALGRPADTLALAKDFSIVRKAINQGIIKPKHITRLGL